MAGFNHSHEEVAFDSQRNVDLRILPLGRLMPHSQKFMNDTLQNKVNMMEGRIVGFIDRLRKTTGVEATENVAIPVQEPTWVAGQICCDSDEGRLNPTSIELMGSLLYSEGSVAKLDVSRLQNYRLYPGQVVAVQGVNPTGETFVAMDLITKCPKPMHSTASQQLQLSVPTPAKFRLLVASGPFTTMGDLRYGPLKKLGELCRQEKFDAALLIGPFVDVDHPMLSKGSIDISFEELFQSEVGTQHSKVQNAVNVLQPPMLGF
ncbi:unnamed protein product [Ostreobium quekettii]|uniref:DNA polymerase alpha subunit B OB domain-containing protein n=1 Tax=Ostreobium quekettii TaxID=121088 RepID=A0A8S1J0R4_9CHLO|nr:unnamed protein product [Ostreobium quekettii]